jgi:predicted regulator of Ras-like GTPase activity (Roadblock/LC7/MglB family)
MHQDLLVHLRNLRDRRDEVEGSVVATTDGMVIAHDLGATETYGIEPAGVAALAAVSLGISQRIADTASHGDLRETVISGSFGQVVTYPAGDRALLTVLVNTTGELGSLHLDARAVATRIALVVTHAWPDLAPSWSEGRAGAE